MKLDELDRALTGYALAAMIGGVVAATLPVVASVAVVLAAVYAGLRIYVKVKERKGGDVVEAEIVEDKNKKEEK